MLERAQRRQRGLWKLARHYSETDTTVSLLWSPEEDLLEVETTRFGVRVVEDEGLSELTGNCRGKGRAVVDRGGPRAFPPLLGSSRTR